MKTFWHSNIVLAIGTILSVLVSSSAMAILPTGNYACQVHTRGGASGLVLVQGVSLEEAIVTAKANDQAMLLDGATGVAVGVVECIDRNIGQKFKDVSFQAIYEAMPM